MTDSDKHSSLLRYRKNYDCKKFYGEFVVAIKHLIYSVSFRKMFTAGYQLVAGAVKLFTAVSYEFLL